MMAMINRVELRGDLLGGVLPGEAGGFVVAKLDTAFSSYELLDRFSTVPVRVRIWSRIWKGS